MLEVGVRAFKESLSEYLHRAEKGERIVVTDRGRPLAQLSPVDDSPAVRAAWKLVERGVASWSGGKPRGATAPVKLEGKLTAAEMLLEDRG